MIATIVSVCGLLVAVTSFVLSRTVTRRVRVRVHRASFVQDGLGPVPQYYFVNVTNLSLNREVELTHVWFDFSEPVTVVRNERPLPKRLKPDETWETWIPVIALPHTLQEPEVYKRARVRLSTGRVFRSKQNKKVPGVGSIPGGDPPRATIGAR
jgi:hypothetical protein